VQALTPREIVAELDKYIIGQNDAKRAVAIALRNRWRWQQLPEEVRRDIMPKNIIMIGPTGVGKTEITRRFAKLTAAGLAAAVFYYVAINLMMVMGLAPVVGIPLPLVSFGGSAQMTVLISLGIMMAIDHDNRRQKRW